MSELSAAIHLIDPMLAGLRTLETQRDGMTDAEYRAAYRALAGAAETGPRCARCGAPAYIGATCAACTDIGSVMQAAQGARPILDLSRYTTPSALITAVMTALETTGREKPAAHFLERALDAPGMNALVMIAKEYVRLENRLGVRDERR